MTAPTTDRRERLQEKVDALQAVPNSIETGLTLRRGRAEMVGRMCDQTQESPIFDVETRYAFQEVGRMAKVVQTACERAQDALADKRLLREKREILETLWKELIVGHAKHVAEQGPAPESKVRPMAQKAEAPQRQARTA